MVFGQSTVNCKSSPSHFVLRSENHQHGLGHPSSGAVLICCPLFLEIWKITMPLFEELEFKEIQILWYSHAIRMR